MPIYVFRCDYCMQGTKDSEREVFFRVPRVTHPVFCHKCGAPMQRVYDSQNVAVRGDIEPGYDISLGEYVGSRRELREKLAYANAYNPDLMMNGAPSAGRLTSEERAEVEGRSVPVSQTIFEKRKQPGWGNNPSGDEAVVTEGESNYGKIRESIKQAHGR